VTPSRSHLRRLLVCFALAALVLVPTSPAHAEPTLEEIEAQIDAAWRELEPLIEQYNRVRSELKANQELSEQLSEEIAPLELKMDVAMAGLEVIAARQYKGGSMSAVNSLLASGSPTTFVEQLALLDFVARDQRQQIEAAREARDDYEEEKAKIDSLIEEQEAQQADLEQRADQIERDLERLEDLARQARARQQQQAQAAQTGNCPEVVSSGPGAVAAQFACAQLGKPYVWGANGPDAYDCSGLTQQAWAAAGVSLTHYTGAQWNEGRAVSRSEAIPGDLVFFYSDLSHMGLYIGAGMMVHAPRPGLDVRMSSIDSMPIAGFRRPG
jgi:peptidoglycan DL-endopeptidase CwlO